MLKIILAFLFILSFTFPQKAYYVFCKMSKDTKCQCSGVHSKHSCCKIIKIQKELNFNLKNPEKIFHLNFLYFKEISKENFIFWSLKKEKNLNIHSPPIFLKNLNLLI